MSEFESNKTSGDDPIADALKRWANDDHGYQRLDPSSMSLERHAPVPRTRFGWRTAATLAAAALFVFALAQASFTISVGNTTLQWGHGEVTNADALSAQLAEAKAQIATFENQLNTHAEAINTVAAQNALLNDSLYATAVELAQRQELESAARFYDMQNLAQLVTYQP